jgi:asparagine synthase (glutamine-hydrolysing)
LADFFVYRFIPSPNSIWCDIKKLPPGHTLTYKVGGEPVVKQYWKLPVSSLTLSPNEVLEKCEQLVNASVQSHLLSDVPVGLFLSGGYDSSLMAYYMHRLGYPINSFTIGFKDWERSEHLAAQEISKIYDGSHTKQILDNENLLQVEDLAYYYDEPLGGSSFLPTYYVSKLAASKVKVVLSGDGGDEVFAGYKWHKSIYHKYYTSFPDLLKRKVQGKNRFLLNSYWNMMSWAGFHYNDVPNVLGDLMSSGDRNKDDVWYYKKYLQTQYGPVKAFQLLDFHSFLPEVVLTKVDRASMANSLEVRVPLLDHDLAEFVMSLQEEGVFDINQNKKIIRSILSSSLPQAILNRPKSGFGAPVKNVDTVDLIARVRDSIVYKENLINRKYFEEQIVGQRNMKKAWAMFVFSAWANKWL